MRKGLTIVSVLALVLVGFIAMANPVAACHFEFKKELTPWGPSHDNDAIPAGVNQIWELLIVIRAEQDMYEVCVKDRFGGELEVEYPPIGPDPWLGGLLPGDLVITTKGKTEKVAIEWCIPKVEKNTVAILRMFIGTDVNPGGHQEYTTPGFYPLNSGAVLTYKDGDGNKFTETTEDFWITVV